MYLHSFCICLRFGLGSSPKLQGKSAATPGGWTERHVHFWISACGGVQESYHEGHLCVAWREYNWGGLWRGCRGRFLHNENHWFGAYWAELCTMLRARCFLTELSQWNLAIVTPFYRWENKRGRGCSGHSPRFRFTVKLMTVTWWVPVGPCT